MPQVPSGAYRCQAVEWSCKHRLASKFGGEGASKPAWYQGHLLCPLINISFPKKYFFPSGIKTELYSKSTHTHCFEETDLRKLHLRNMKQWHFLLILPECSNTTIYLKNAKFQDPYTHHRSVFQPHTRKPEVCDFCVLVKSKTTQDHFYQYKILPFGFSSAKALEDQINNWKSRNCRSKPCF